MSSLTRTSVTSVSALMDAHSLLSKRFYTINIHLPFAGGLQFALHFLANLLSSVFNRNSVYPLQAESPINIMVEHESRPLGDGVQRLLFR